MNQKYWSDYSEYFDDINLKAGFTNIHFPYVKPDDRIEFAKILGLNSENIIRPIQTHSSDIVQCDNAGIYKDIDGTITINKKLVLSIQVADCIPIFIVDTKLIVFGLVHAGWRGVSKNIVNNIVNELDKLNLNFDNIKILLGPSIRQCCFEIGPEVAELFDDKFLTNGDGNRSFLDLQGQVKSKFEQYGITHNQIIDIMECTCCSEKYHSYRRDGEKSGRMIAMMGFI